VVRCNVTNRREREASVSDGSARDRFMLTHACLCGRLVSDEELLVALGVDLDGHCVVVQDPDDRTSWDRGQLCVLEDENVGHSVERIYRLSRGGFEVI